MQYRPLGKTGIQAGVVGLGLEHTDGKPYEVVKETIDAAIDNGINIMDVFMPGKQVRENIFKALGGRRKDVFIQGHIGSTDINQQYDISRDMPTVQKYFEDLLRMAGGYIDLGMMFFIDSEKDYQNVFETEFASYVLRLKEKGDIGHIGFSSHNPATAIKVIETGIPEMLMFSINPAFDMLPSEQYALGVLDDNFSKVTLHGVDPERAKLYALCEQRQIGITVMKTLGAGKLLSKEHTPFKRALTVPQCIHYALSRPAVASTLVGCQNRQQIEEAVKYLQLSPEELDYSDALSAMRNDFRGRCVYCSHCQPCPAGIDIARVNKYLDIAKLDESHVPPSIIGHYKELEHKGDECIQCGNCESRCPFGVPVIDNMAAAAELLK